MSGRYDKGREALPSVPDGGRVMEGQKPELSRVWRAAFYCRLSREDGDKPESNSIASQRAILEEYTARRDDLRWCSSFQDEAAIIGLNQNPNIRVSI